MPPRLLQVGKTYRSNRHTGLWRTLLKIEGDTAHFETNWSDTLTVTMCSLRSFAAWASEEIPGVPGEQGDQLAATVRKPTQ